MSTAIKFKIRLKTKVDLPFKIDPKKLLKLKIVALDTGVSFEDLIEDLIDQALHQMGTFSGEKAAQVCGVSWAQWRVAQWRGASWTPKAIAVPLRQQRFDKEAVIACASHFRKRSV